jgi:hypothetical protein
VTCNLGDRRDIRAWKDANRQGHVEARLFDVLGERVIIVVDGMLMNYSISVPMSDDMTMHPVMRMAENEAEIVVAGVSGRRFRCGNKHPLQRNGHSRRDHEDDGDASGQGLSSEAQTANLSVCRANTIGDYTMMGGGHNQGNQGQRTAAPYYITI